MRKRFLSIILTVCMLLSMLPQTALAANTINIQGNNYTIGGEVTTTGLDLNTAPSENTYYKAGDGYILWNGNGALTLNNATIDITTSSAFALTLKNDADVHLMLEGQSVLKAKESTIKCDDGNYKCLYIAKYINNGGTLSVSSETASAMDLGLMKVSVNSEVTLIVGDDARNKDVPLIQKIDFLYNFGTLKFPKGTTNEEIKEMNIVSYGETMIDDTIIGIAEGIVYPWGGDVTNTGLDLDVNTPTLDTYYKAGIGYLLFSPSNGTLTMGNMNMMANQDKPLITLPKRDIKLVLKGFNTLENTYNSNTFAMAIQQGELLNIGGSASAIEPKNYSLTFSGEGVLDVRTSENQASSISTDGTFVMESGTVKKWPGTEKKLRY